VHDEGSGSGDERQPIPRLRAAKLRAHTIPHNILPWREERRARTLPRNDRGGDRDVQMGRRGEETAAWRTPQGGPGGDAISASKYASPQGVNLAATTIVDAVTRVRQPASGQLRSSSRLPAEPQSRLFFLRIPRKISRETRATPVARQSLSTKSYQQPEAEEVTPGAGSATFPPPKQQQRSARFQAAFLAGCWPMADRSE